MQPGRRRRDRAALFRINSLVSFAIFSRNTCRTLDVWRQRRRSDLPEHVVKWTVSVKTHTTQLWSGFVEKFGNQPALTKDRPRTLFQPAAGTNKRFPDLRFDLAYEEDLDLSTRLLTMPEQPRGNHTRVVHDDNIVWPQILRELSKIRISPRLRLAIQNQHPRRVA